MKVSPSLFRKIHKWVGLVLGIQFLLWTVSGLGMALLDHEEVSGGHSAPATAPLPLGSGAGWSAVQRSLGPVAVNGLTVRPLLDRQIFEVSMPGGARLFDAETGSSIQVDATLASAIATAEYNGEPQVKRVSPLDELTPAVRDHELPIWRVDFEDDKNSSFYVSGSTGRLLERRNDSWRLFDLLWMLHNMDYVNRSSFNHPLIVMVTFGTLWLAGTGFYLLFKSGWRQELKWVRRRRSKRA